MTFKDLWVVSVLKNILFFFGSSFSMVYKTDETLSGSRSREGKGIRKTGKSLLNTVT